MPDRLSYRDAAAAVAQSPPPLGDWPRAGAWPLRDAIRHLRVAGWPLREIDALVPASTAPGRGAGKIVPQPVTLVPETWLREFARLVGKPWGPETCRGLVQIPADA